MATTMSSCCTPLLRRYSTTPDPASPPSISIALLPGARMRIASPWPTSMKWTSTEPIEATDACVGEGDALAASDGAWVDGATGVGEAALTGACAAGVLAIVGDAMGWVGADAVVSGVSCGDAIGLGCVSETQPPMLSSRQSTRRPGIMRLSRFIALTPLYAVAPRLGRRRSSPSFPSTPIPGLVACLVPLVL